MELRRRSGGRGLRRRPRVAEQAHEGIRGPQHGPHDPQRDDAAEHDRHDAGRRRGSGTETIAAVETAEVASWKPVTPSDVASASQPSYDLRNVASGPERGLDGRLGLTAAGRRRSPPRAPRASARTLAGLGYGSPRWFGLAAWSAAVERGARQRDPAVHLGQRTRAAADEVAALVVGEALGVQRRGLDRIGEAGLALSEGGVVADGQDEADRDGDRDHEQHDEARDGREHLDVERQRRRRAIGAGSAGSSFTARGSGGGRSATSYGAPRRSLDQMATATGQMRT